MRQVLRAAIFDLDGTLVDTLADIEHCVNLALAELGYKAEGRDKIQRAIGSGVEELFRALRNDLAEDETAIASLCETFRHHYGTHFLQASAPYEGISELLSELDARRIPIGILSNKPETFCAALVEALFPHIPFRAVRGARRDIPLKPSPLAAYRIAERLGVEPELTAFIGDSRIDIETALRAGMVPIGVAWGFRSRAELVEAGAHTIAAHPRELRRFFAGD